MLNRELYLKNLLENRNRIFSNEETPKVDYKIAEIPEKEIPETVIPKVENLKVKNDTKHPLFLEVLSEKEDKSSTDPMKNYDYFLPEIQDKPYDKIFSNYDKFDQEQIKYWKDLYGWQPELIERVVGDRRLVDANLEKNPVKKTSMDRFELEILKFINEISNSKYQYFRLNDTILKTNRNMDMDLGILHDKAANEINNAYFEANINQIKEEIKLVQNNYPLNEPEPDD
jgi:hypothetical protein